MDRTQHKGVRATYVDSQGRRFRRRHRREEEEADRGGGERMLPDYIDLAEAFVPIQPYGERFPLAEALEKGTLFVDLYQPYTGRRPYRERGRRM